MKKIILTAFTLALFTGGAFAQAETQTKKPNTVSTGRDDAAGLKVGTQKGTRATDAKRKHVEPQLQPAANPNAEIGNQPNQPANPSQGQGIIYNAAVKGKDKSLEPQR